MARISWFDEKSDVPVIHEQARKLESFTMAMSDGVISRQELEKQQSSVASLMRDVERSLSDEQHTQVTRLLVEMSAYNIMRLVHELQSQRLQKTLKGG